MRAAVTVVLAEHVIGKHGTETELREIDLGETASRHAGNGYLRAIERHRAGPGSQFGRQYSALLTPPHAITLLPESLATPPDRFRTPRRAVARLGSRRPESAIAAVRAEN